MVAPAPAPKTKKTIDQCLADFHGCMTTSTLAPAPAARTVSAPAARASAPAARASAPAADPCAGLTDSSLASSVSLACLQKTFKSMGCSEQGTVYPKNTGGWWGSSPNNSGTPVYCGTGQTSGNGPNQCGAGNFGIIKTDMKAWATLPDQTRKQGCYGPTLAAAAGSAVLSTGQAIQTAILTITTNPAPALTTQPTGITATGSFTLSIDINMTTLPNGSLLRVIGQGAHPGQPGLWLFPAGSGGNVWLRFHVGNSAVDLVTGTTPPTYNTYYNITAVYDAQTRKATLYHNGVLAGSAAIDPTGFKPPTPSMFGWNQQNLTAPTVKVKNVYWFNKALTPAEIKTISRSSSGTGTSGYAMEGSPFGGVVGTGRNTKLILTLLVLVILLWILAKKM